MTPEKQLLRCKSPGCSSTPMSIPLAHALATIEHARLDNPHFSLGLDCDKCRRTSRYSFLEVLEAISPEKRPRLMPTINQWVFVLMEIGRMEDGSTAYVGDRFIVKLAELSGGEWFGELAEGNSVFAPSLQRGTMLTGIKSNDYHIATSTFINGDKRPIPLRTDMPSGAVFSIAYKRPEGSYFFENACCSNPGCSWFFKITHTEFAATEKPIAAARLLIDCPQCGLTRVIDSRSFSMPPTTRHPSVIEEIPVSDHVSGSRLWVERDRSKQWIVMVGEGEHTNMYVALGSIATPKEFVFAVTECARVAEVQITAGEVSDAIDQVEESDSALADAIRRDLGARDTKPVQARNRPDVITERSQKNEGVTDTLRDKQHLLRTDDPMLVVILALGVGRHDRYKDYDGTEALMTVHLIAPAFDWSNGRSLEEEAKVLGDVLSEYIQIHDYLYGGGVLRTLRRIIRLPGFVEKIDFPGQVPKLAVLRYALEVIDERIKERFGSLILGVGLRDYTRALATAVYKLELLSHRLARKTNGEPYSSDAYQADLIAYREAIDRYRQLGQVLNYSMGSNS